MREPLSTSVVLPDVAATEALGRHLAERLPPDTSGWMILLQGDLGSGKSTLARALLRSLGHRGPVPSPTYTLVEPYEVAGGIVYHIDLYRIAAEEELTFLGWSDLRGGLLLVEWPERVPRLLEEADLQVALAFAGAGRKAELTAFHDRAAGLLAGLPRRFGAPDAVDS
jgi:tRNA threonylcarbamoyladenosine biosynthesis protein TsaE